MRKLSVLTGGAAALAALVCCWTVQLASSREAERLSDQDLQRQFSQSHGLMKQQRVRLGGILDAFLVGDLRTVNRYADEIGQDMRKAGQLFAPDRGQEAEQWKTMAEVVEQAQLLQQAVHEGKYQPAYQHYAKLASACIACHQVRREWGKFPELKPVRSAEPPPAGPGP